MVLYNTSLRKTPQRHRKSRMQTSGMRTAPTNKNKKVEKSCWQTENTVIWYQSCSGRETTEKQLKNLDNWTVKQPWKFLKSFIFKELTFKNSKKGMNSQVVILNRIKPRRIISDSVNVRISPAQAREILSTHILSESLILAQDERWRRA